MIPKFEQNTISALELEIATTATDQLTIARDFGPMDDGEI